MRLRDICLLIFFSITNVSEAGNKPLPTAEVRMPS